MAGAVNPTIINSESLQPGRLNILMRVTGGNSPIEQAKVVLVGTHNHYDPTRQQAIARTLNILPQPGDVVLTEGEWNSGRLNGTWIPEMAGVDTKNVTLRGWEVPSLYKQATEITKGLSADMQMLNMLIGINLGQLAIPFIDYLKHRINSSMANFDRIVWHERTKAMKASIMDVIGHSLQAASTLFVYAGAAHLTRSELGSTLNGINHVVLEV